MSKTGLLLINLGTPDAPNIKSVWRYLQEFLADKRVVTLPAPLRFLLLYGFILPFRTAKTTRAYQAIWNKKGSPLRYHGEALCHQLQQYLGEGYQVALAMRYGHPGIKQALNVLQSCERLLILPLYPQYSSSASGSSLESALSNLARQTFIPHVTVMREFYQHPAFIHAQAQQIRPYLGEQERVIFSYHGLPESHITAGQCQSLCPNPCTREDQPTCYRAQCYQTSALLAEALQLQPSHYLTVFQSRLGRTPWIQPYMEDALKNLATQGVRRIVFVCPSFVADCLETLEEVGIRMAALWQKIGGAQLTLVPSLNSELEWCKAITSLFSIVPTNE